MNFKKILDKFLNGNIKKEYNELHHINAYWDTYNNIF